MSSSSFDRYLLPVMRCVLSEHSNLPTDEVPLVLDAPLSHVPLPFGADKYLA